MFKDDLLAGKRALISGGGTGLGKAMGHRFMELGADLVICGRREEVLDETAGEFADQFGRAVEVQGFDQVVESLVAYRAGHRFQRPAW